MRAPKRRVEQKGIGRGWLWAAGAAALALAIAIPAAILASGGGSDEAVSSPAAGLPDTPDYHETLYKTDDGGATWRPVA